MEAIVLHKIRRSGVLVASFCISVSAHAAESATSPVTMLDLEDSNWQLIQMTVLGGYEFKPELPGKYVPNFRSDSRLTGSSDCNDLVLNLRNANGFEIVDGKMIVSTTTEGVELIFETR